MNSIWPQADQDRIRKLRGEACYTADHSFPASLQAAFVRSPHACARIVSITTEAAQRMPHVVRVLTAQDCKAAGLGSPPVIDRIGEGLIAPLLPIMAAGAVRFAGEVVACVIAETEAAALDAAEAVLVEYEPSQAAIGLAAALAVDAPLVHPDTPGNVALRHEAGDATAVAVAFGQAATVVATTIELPRLAPMTLEPRAAAARWDAAREVYELRAPHQGVNEIRRDLAAIFGLPRDRFVVLSGEVGGGFGPRAIVYPEYAALLLASRLVGRPVAWHGTRSESFLTDIQGRGVVMSGRLALDASGVFTALSITYDNDLGAYISPVAVFAAVHNPLQSMTGCYAIPAAHAAFRTVHTNSVPTGPYRGAGRPEMALLVERLVDLAAARLGCDRFLLRERNAIPAAAFPWRLPSDALYDSGDFLRLLRTAHSAADWDGFPGRKAAAAAEGVVLGRGMGLFIEVSGGGAMPDEAALTLSAEAARAALRIETVTNTTGQSHARTFATIAAPVLGLEETAVTLRASDPGSRLSGAGSYASRSTIAAGSAVAQAAEAIAAVLRERAALRGNCAPADVRLADQAAWREDGSLICPLAALLPAPLCQTGHVEPSNAFASGCHVAEVAVDGATGAVTLTRYVAVDDAGVTIDKQAADAQIHGGIAQGVGEVLGEAYVLDAASGQPIAASLQDYMVPRANDLPLYQVIECNTPSPANPLGVKGIGEAGTTGALCSVTSAVADALGRAALPAMPFTPMRVWEAMCTDVVDSDSSQTS